MSKKKSIGITTEAFAFEMEENNRPGTGRLHGALALALAAVAFMSGWHGSLTAAESRDPSIPLVQVAPTNEKIVIDGKMDEAVWGEVPVLGPFVNLRGDGYPVAQTEARITRTDKALVIFLRCHEPTMDKLRVAAGKGVFGDDHIEVFVQGTEKESDFFQLVVNSRGNRIQMANSDQWDGAWETAGGTFDGGWTLEIALPFATLGRDPGKLDSLRLNICRDRPHALELSSWSSPRGGHFRTFSRFGELRFVAHLPLQWTVRPPSLGEGAEPLFDLTCEPFAAKNVENPFLYQPEYTATVQTYSENIPVAVSEQKAKFVLGEHRTLRLPFVPPPGRKPSVSIALRDPSGSEVLVTSDFPIAVSDPRREFLRQIHAALEELRSAHVPKQFAKRFEAWRKEAAVCTEQTDAEQLRTLAQALRSVSFAATLSDGDTAAATTFVLPAFTKTAYDQIPERTGQPLACSVFRGETESMSVNIFAFRDLADVTVAVDDLKFGTATVAASNLDTRLVMNWWQSSSDTFVSTTPVLVPELLVKDDAIVTLDMAKQRNVFNFDPRIGPEDPAQLRPFTIPEFHNRQVLLTLRTPEKQPPGVYAGRVVVSAGGKPVVTVPCTVTVLPVTWETTHGEFSAYSYTTLDESLKETDPRPGPRRVPRGYYERYLALAREYGMNALPVIEDGTAKWNGKTWDVELSRVREALRLRRQHGLTGATDYYGFLWNFAPLGMVYSWKDFSELESPAPGTTPDGFVEACRQLKGLADEMGFREFYVYGLDEPSYHNKIPQETVVCRLIQKSGLQAVSAIMLKDAIKLKDVLARPILSPEGIVVGDRSPIGGLTKAVHYGHPVEDYVRDRFLTGVMTWYGGLHGRCPWMMENGWDDFTPGNNNHRPLGYIYRGRNTPIPTVQLLAYREGVDDFTLLEMLERRVGACRGKKLDHTAAKAFAEAETLARSAPAKFRINYVDASTKLTVKDFDQFRAELQRLIVALDAAAGSTP